MLHTDVSTVSVYVSLDAHLSQAIARDGKQYDRPHRGSPPFVGSPYRPVSFQCLDGYTPTLRSSSPLETDMAMIGRHACR
jgi:hypothetical protein